MMMMISSTSIIVWYRKITKCQNNWDIIMTSWHWFCKGLKYMLGVKQSSDPVERITELQKELKLSRNALLKVRHDFCFTTGNCTSKLLTFYFSHKIPAEFRCMEPGSLKILDSLLMATRRILNISLCCANAGGKADSSCYETSLPTVSISSSHEVNPSHVICLNKILARIL